MILSITLNPRDLILLKVIHINIIKKIILSGLHAVPSFLRFFLFLFLSSIFFSKQYNLAVCFFCLQEKETER